MPSSPQFPPPTAPIPSSRGGRWLGMLVLFGKSSPEPVLKIWSCSHNPAVPGWALQGGCPSNFSAPQHPSVKGG